MRAIPTLKISISGVRGVVGDSLTPILLTRFAQAFGTYVGGGRVVVGRDPRTSGEMVWRAVAAGLLSSGCRIIDLGVCPTPTVQLIVRRTEARGGIAITASHNPPEWNALKFVGADGLFLSADRGRELLDIYHQGDYTKVAGAEMRPVEAMPDALDVHIQAILDALGPLPQTPRRLRVIVDSCNGAGSIVTPRLLEKLGAEVIAINVTPDGSFPRPAEPTPANLVALCDAVRQHRADIGFAQDMDADRLALVSDTGVPLSEERTLVLAARAVLAKTPGTVVTNLSTTHTLDQVTAQFGCRVARTKVGEANVTEGMLRERAVIGGEGNGGVIYPRINFARDSLVGMALVLHVLAESGRTLSQLDAELPPIHMVKRQLECPSHQIPAVLKQLRGTYAGSPMDLRDGVKVTLADGWFHVRGSNTEPVVRLVAEAESAARAEEIAGKIAAQIQTWAG
jgi:phosphomannomutase